MLENWSVGIVRHVCTVRTERLALALALALALRTEQSLRSLGCFGIWNNTPSTFRENISHTFKQASSKFKYAVKIFTSSPDLLQIGCIDIVARVEVYND